MASLLLAGKQEWKTSAACLRRLSKWRVQDPSSGRPTPGCVPGDHCRLLSLGREDFWLRQDGNPFVPWAAGDIGLKGPSDLVPHPELTQPGLQSQ